MLKTSFLLFTVVSCVGVFASRLLIKAFVIQGKSQRITYLFDENQCRELLVLLGSHYVGMAFLYRVVAHDHCPCMEYRSSRSDCL